MAGQIIPRGDSVWVVRVFLGRDNSGKRRYHNKTIHGNKKDAQKYLNAVLRDQDLGAFVEPTKMTVDEYLDQWLETAAKSTSHRTATDYKDLLRRYVRPSLGKRRFSDITPIEIQALYNKMQEQGLSPRTVRYTHAVLSSAFKQAIKWRLIPLNPASAVELPRQQRKEMQALSPEDAAKFLKAAGNDRWGIIFAVALLTGMRPEEYLGLQWKDVDLNTGVVTIQRTLVWRRKGGGWYFGEPKTNRSRRSIPLPASVLRGLKEHKARQSEEKMKRRQDYQDLDLVFATAEGGPLAHQNLFRRHFKPILTAAELPSSIRLYDLRHSCATLLLAANENPKVVSERLGHASITMTMDIYSHVLPTMQQAASEKLEKIVLGQRSNKRKS